MLHGRGFVIDYLGIPYKAYAPPLPPLALALLYKLFGESHLLALAFQSACGVALAVAAGLLAQSMINTRTGLLAGLFTGAHPGIIYYDVHNLHPFSLGVLAFVAALAAFWLILQHPSDWRLWFAPGAAIGLATLTRGSLILFLPLGLVWLYLAGINWKPLAGIGAASILALAVIVTPWVVRNWVLLGKPILLSTTDMLLWVGNNPNATGGWYNAAGRNMLELAPTDLMGRVDAQSDELGQAAVFRQAAYSYMLSDPIGVLRRSALKTMYMWTWSPYLGVTYPRAFLIPYLGFNTGMSLLALLGIGSSVGMGRRGQLAVALILSFCIAETLFRSVFYVEGRHRWGMEPAVYVLSAIGFLTLVSPIWRKGSKLSSHTAS